MLSINANSETFQLGDLAPRGAPDGQLDVSDSLLLQRIILGDIVPTDDEKLIGDVAPLGSPDGELNVGDLVVQQRAILGLETLGTVDTNTFTFTPELNPVTPPINQNPYQISGSAQPGTSIEIYVNNVLQAITLVVADGSFRSYVTLDESIANDVYAIAWDGSIYSNQSNHLNLTFGLTTPIFDNISGSTTSASQTISGQAYSGTAVQIYNNGSLVDTVSTDISGNFTSNITLTDGVNTIYAVAVNGTAISAPSTTVDIEYYTIAIEPKLNPGTSPTNHNPYSISGTGLPNEQINIYVNGVLQSTINSNSSGNFSTTVILATGSNTITATARSGLSESFPSAPITIIYDAAFTTTPISGALSGTPFTPGVVYEVTADIIVGNGQTLTIPAGTVLRFSPGVKINVGVSASNNQVVGGGTLTINGTSSNPVILTSVDDTPETNDWYGIVVYGIAGAPSVLNINNAIIEYATVGMFGLYNVTGTVTNSTLRYNSTGIAANSNSSFGQPTFVVNNSSFYGNSGQNYLASNSLAVMDARNNWWGSADVDAIESKLTIGKVNYLPYLTSLDGSPIAGTSLTGPISGNMTLVAGTTYLVAEKVYVTGSLTIPAGTTLKFAKGAQLYVGRNSSNQVVGGGALTINGTSTNPVILTSVDDTPGSYDWGGITIFGTASAPSALNINNAIIEYAAQGIYALYNVSGSVINSTIRYNGTGVLASGSNNASNDPSFTVSSSNLYNNSALNYQASNMVGVMDARNNWWGSADVDAIESKLTIGKVNYLPYLTSLDGSPIAGTSLTGPISGNMTLVAGTTYLVAEKVYVTGSLTIPAGTTLKFAKGAQLYVGRNSSNQVVGGGALTINGTSTNPVILTSVDDTPGSYDWGGITIFGTASAPSALNINNAIIEYAAQGIYALYNVSGSVINSTIRYNGTGVLASGSNNASNDPSFTVSSSNLYNNSALNYQASNMVGVMDARNNWWGSADVDAIESKLTIGKVNYLPYLTSLDGSPIAGTSLTGPISGNMTLVAGTTYLVAEKVYVTGSLTIPAGTTLKFAKGAQLYVGRNSSNQVVGGGALTINGTSTNPVILTSVDDTPGSYDWGGITIFGTASAPSALNINNAIIEYAAQGIYALYNVSGSVINSTIRYNGTGVLASGSNNASNDPSFTVSSSNLYNNSALNYQASNMVGVMDARNNWWGSADVDAIESKLTIGKVNYLPYLTSLDGSPIAGTSLTGPISGNMTLVAGTTYLVAEKVYVTGSLTIPAGTTLKFAKGAQLYVGRNSSNQVVGGGALTINGTSTNPVILTSVDDTPGSYDWGGITIFGTASAPSALNINNAIIEYAAQGIYALYNVSGSVINSTIRYNGTGVLASGSNNASNDPSFTVSSSNLYNNSALNYQASNMVGVMDARNNWWGSADVDAIESKLTIGKVNYLPYLTSLDGSPIAGTSLTGPISGNTTLVAGATYLITGDLRVTGGTLTIPAGAILKFTKSGRLVIGLNAGSAIVGGVLNINGTSSNPVILTSIDDTPAPNAWGGIVAYGSASAPTVLNINNVIIEYASVGLSALYNVAGTVTNSTLRYNLRGIEVRGSSSSSFGQPTFTVNNSSFYGNGLNYLASNSLAIMDARNNWWGSADVDTIESTLTVGKVDYANYLTTGYVPPPPPPPISISNVSYSTTSSQNITIDPLAGELAHVQFTLDTSATVHVRWYREDTNILVRDISQSLGVGTHNVSWNGKDASGFDVPNNAYYFKIYATNGISTGNYFVNGGGVVATIPGGFSNTINAYTNELFKSTITAPSPGCDTGCRTQLTVTDPANAANNFIAFDGQYEPGTYTVSWDLRDQSGALVSGSRQILLKDFVTLKPNSVIVKNTVEDFHVIGTGAFPDIEVQSDPYAIYHSYEQFSKVEYHLDRASFVTVKILPPNIIDPNDPSVIELMPSTLQSASVSGAPYSFSWQGYTDAVGLRNNINVSEEGPYTYLIEAVSQADGSTATYRGFITMFH